MVGFHSFPGWVRGGFVGVDVFFVISGFLITGIIIDELNRDDFSFVRFYARRIRRIFPALIVVLAASFWLGWMLLLPDEMTSLGKNIFGGATFSSNLVLLAEGGYFDIEAVRKPLLHLWSLGIEEQFYILWPVLLFVSFKHGLNLFSLICLLLLTSFVANVASVAHHPAGTFYLPHTRAWELLGGGLLAWAAAYTSRASLTEVERRGDAFLQHAIFARPSALSHGLFLNARAFAGTILVTAAVVGLSANTRFPGWAAVLPNLGAVLILSAEGSAINRYVLGSHPFIFIGKISYPLYLWHWVLFSFAGIALAAPPGRGDRVAIILAGVALAWLTYALVERPLRFGAGRRVKAILLCVAVTAIGGVGFVTVVAKGFDRLPAFLEDLSLIKMDPEKDWRRGKCFLELGMIHRNSPTAASKRIAARSFFYGRLCRGLSLSRSAERTEDFRFRLG